MTVSALLDELRQRGIRLTMNGANIRVQWPRASPTPDLIEVIRARKPELLVHLARQQMDDSPTVLLTGGEGGQTEYSVVPAVAGTDDHAAKALLGRLLDEGSTFKVVPHRGEDVLLWFGPASTVAPEIRAQVTQHKPRIIALLRAGHARSHRKWGEPTADDWARHPYFGGDGGSK